MLCSPKTESLVLLSAEQLKKTKEMMWLWLNTWRGWDAGQLCRGGFIFPLTTWASWGVWTDCRQIGSDLLQPAAETYFSGKHKEMSVSDSTSVTAEFSGISWLESACWTPSLRSLLAFVLHADSWLRMIQPIYCFQACGFKALQHKKPNWPTEMTQWEAFCWLITPLKKAESLL